MKTTKTLLTIALVTGFTSVSHATATTYIISGQLAGASIPVVYTPTNPSFTGSMMLDLATTQITPGVFQFAPYSDYVPWQNATYTVPNETISYATGNGSWSSWTLSFSSIDYVNQQPGGTCTGDTCAPNLDGHLGVLTMDLLFSGNPNHFTGVATATDSTYGYSRTFTFTGTAVPVPAAAWLFGSGLIGLAGAARRKSKAA